MNKKILFLLFLLGIVATVNCLGQEVDKQIPANSKIFVSPISDEFDRYIVDAFKSKKIPLEIVTEKGKADFELTGTSESKKAGAAKMILLGSWHSAEQASITVVNLKSGVAVWAYSVNKSNSAHGKRTTAEACAKHLKEKIESKK